MNSNKLWQLLCLTETVTHPRCHNELLGVTGNELTAAVCQGRKLIGRKIRIFWKKKTLLCGERRKNQQASSKLGMLCCGSGWCSLGHTSNSSSSSRSGSLRVTDSFFFLKTPHRLPGRLQRVSHQWGGHQPSPVFLPAEVANFHVINHPYQAQTLILSVPLSPDVIRVLIPSVFPQCDCSFFPFPSFWPLFTFVVIYWDKSPVDFPPSYGDKTLTSKLNWVQDGKKKQKCNR